MYAETENTVPFRKYVKQIHVKWDKIQYSYNNVYGTKLCNKNKHYKHTPI